MRNTAKTLHFERRLTKQLFGSAAWTSELSHEQLHGGHQWSIKEDS